MYVSRRATLGALIAASAACAAPQTLSADVRETLRVNGGDVAVRRRRGRGPLVVFEAGLGDGLESWDALLPLLGEGLPYFAYSRPGQPGSTAVAQPDGMLTSDEAARFLSATLASAGERGPFVLVGHSLGGIFIAKYAELFPARVAGLVFIDGRPPGFRARCIREDVARCRNQPPRDPTWPDWVSAEWAGVAASEAMAPPAAQLAHIPATVITATDTFGENGAAAAAVWIAEQEAFAAGFRDHRFVRADGVGHYVHQEQPALVAREIESRLAAL